MKTPAFRPFIDGVGKVVHHLNTIAVGLSGVESGACKKPNGLDISWNPSDLRASSRDARSFALKSTLVFVAEELSIYTNEIIGSPNIGDIQLPKKLDRSIKFEHLCNHIGMSGAHLIYGPLLLIHWRNIIIHKKSNASLSSNQKQLFKDTRDVILSKYKNLCIDELLKHFDKKQPTLKDVSSLTAMTINSVKEIESKISEPSSKQDVTDWLINLKLYDDYKRILRVAKNKPNPGKTIDNFFTTYSPELKSAYLKYGA